LIQVLDLPDDTPTQRYRRVSSWDEHTDPCARSSNKRYFTTSRMTLLGPRSLFQGERPLQEEEEREAALDERDADANPLYHFVLSALAGLCFGGSLLHLAFALF
jgi:hypothetical protein